MLASDDLYKEIEVIEQTIEKETDVYKKSALKAQVLTLKMLHSIRSNTVQFMKHFKVDSIKPKTRVDEPKS